MIQHILFDLDNTLYPPSTGLMAAVDRRIARYFARELGLRLPEAEQLRADYCWQYSSCTTGVLRGARLDLDAFLTDVHAIPVEHHLLAPNPALAAMLKQLQLVKWIFTNAPAEYARRVLDALGVMGHFRGIFDIRFLGFVGKPEPAAYERVLAAIGARGEECAMVEDSVANLAPAAALGMTTVLVTAGGGVPEPWVDVTASDLSELPAVLNSVVRTQTPLALDRVGTST
ncbi:MAG: pyrimidine 5'-nucleotidase [Ardenticatenaceae bacterium]|nr:pyrimidine 5'-nucleotidase [Ardenticatenaceae bacterium]HBY95440.1 pyrimidine 5'-nucleotidase [Chloroflexota bacterium]